MTATRRPHGTGSVYFDPARNKWVGSYEAGWTVRGTRRRRKLYAPTERAARAKLREAMRQVETDQTTGRLTVKRWADTWLDTTRRTLRPATWATNRSCVNLWVVPTIGHRRLDQLTPADIRSVTRAILDAGRSPATAHRAQSVLEKMLRDGIREGHHVPERTLMVEGPTAGETDRGIIPLPDALALLDAASRQPDGSRWVAAFLQGMRQAECLGLTWDCVDLDAGTIDVSWQLKALPYNVARDRSSGFRVPDGYVARQLRGSLHLVRPKTARGRRIIPIVPWMAAALSTWRTVAPPSPYGLVWPRGDGNPRTDADDRAAWYELQDTAGIRHETGRPYLTHEIRHTAATLLLEAGVDDTTMTAILGHSSMRSTQAYLHISDGRRAAAMAALADRLGYTTNPQIEQPGADR